MKFKEFIAKIAPTLSKRTILSELDIIQDSLKTYTIPSHERLEEVFGKSGFKSTEAQAFQAHFVKTLKSNNSFKTITKVFENCSIIIDYLKKEVDEKFQEDVTRATLSMYAVNVLRLVQVLSFVADFGRRLNLYLLNKEITHIVNGQNDLGRVTKAEESFINQFKYQFVNACGKLDIDPKKIEKQFDEIPNILVSIDNVERVKDVTGLVKADPMNLDGFAVKGNPFAIVGMRIATYQAKKYKQAQADLEEVQAKILYLKQQNAGKQDAKLEKQIEYYTDLNNKIKAEIENMDEEYGLR